MNYWDEKYWEKNINGGDFKKDLWVQKYENILDKISGCECLDLGCGIGQFTKYWQDKGFNVTAVDISKKALNKLKENIPNANVKVLDISEKLPFLDSSFDVVFANLSIHYFDSETTKKVMSEIKRVLKDGGYFIGTVNSYNTLEYRDGERIEIEPNYFKEKDICTRFWKLEDFKYFFEGLECIILKEDATVRAGNTKVIFEFIYRK